MNKAVLPFAVVRGCDFMCFNSINSTKGFKSAFLAVLVTTASMSMLFADEPIGGIGAILRAEPHTGQIEIIQVMGNSPAFKAGVQKGAILRAVDGISTDGMTLEECIRRVRGSL